MSADDGALEDDPMQASGTDGDPTDLEDLSRAELSARVELLTEQNRRLRREYARAKRSTYRRTAVGLFGIGILAVAGGVLFPASQTVLFALGGIGAFAGLLTWYLTPERFVAASVGEGVYESLAAVGDQLVGELGLTDDRVYVPTGEPDDVTLFVPQHTAYSIPADAALTALFVVTDDPTERGIAVPPSGRALFGEFERALATDLAPDPGALADQLADGLVEQFELASSVRTESAPGRITVGVTGSVYGDLDRFDHPIPSFCAVGVAQGLDEPVTVSVDDAGDDRVDELVTIRWETEE